MSAVKGALVRLLLTVAKINPFKTIYKPSFQFIFPFSFPVLGGGGVYNQDPSIGLIATAAHVNPYIYSSHSLNFYIKPLYLCRIPSPTLLFGLA